MKPEGYHTVNTCCDCDYGDSYCHDSGDAEDIVCCVDGDYSRDKAWPHYRELTPDEQDWLIQVYGPRHADILDPLMLIDQVCYEHNYSQGRRKEQYLSARIVAPNGVCPRWK